MFKILHKHPLQSFITSLFASFAIVAVANIVQPQQVGAVCYPPTEPAFMGAQVAVRIIEPNGNVRWSDNFTFTVEAIDFQPYGPSYPVDTRAISIPDPSVVGAQTRYTFRATAGGQFTDQCTTSDPTDPFATALTFGDSFDGHPWLACNWGLWGAPAGMEHGLSFRFYNPIVLDTGGLSGFWTTPTDVTIGNGLRDVNNDVLYLKYELQLTWPSNYGGIDQASCSQIAGWAMSTQYGTNPVNISVYFDGPRGAGGKEWNIGPANRYNSYVAATFPGWGTDHGFQFDPRVAPPPGINVLDGSPHAIYVYMNNVFGTPLVGSAVLVACPPQPPVVGGSANCSTITATASDPDSQTSTFNYSITVTQGATVYPPIVRNGAGTSVTVPHPAGIDYRNPFNFSVTATEVGGGGQSTTNNAGFGSQCWFNFTLTPNASVSNLLPNDESPSTANFDSGASLSYMEPGGPAAVNGIDIRHSYYVDKYTGPDYYIPGHNSVLQTRSFGTVSYPAPNAGLGPIPIAAGDKLCASLELEYVSGLVDGSGAVVPGTGVAPASSPPSCITIHNKPYVSFLGNDVAAGSGFGSSCTSFPGKIDAWRNSAGTTGSGVQFAAIASQAIQEFRSASQRTGAGNTALTVANTAGPYGGNFGGSGRCLPDHFGIGTAGKTFSSASTFDATTDGVYYIDPGVSKLTLNSPGTIPHGRRTALYVRGDVFIDGDIAYNDSGWTSINDIQSFSLIVQGGDIYISKDVGRLDGTYIAQPDPLTTNGGKIYTCADPTTKDIFNAVGLYDGCKDKQLTVNGSFIAKQIFLLRTYKSLRDAGPNDTTAPANAAEVFRFSPEMYLAPPATPRTSTSGGSDMQFYATLPPTL